jgi:hypothetical protein
MRPATMAGRSQISRPLIASDGSAVRGYGQSGHGSRHPSGVARGCDLPVSVASAAATRTGWRRRSSLAKPCCSLTAGALGLAGPRLEVLAAAMAEHVRELADQVSVTTVTNDFEPGGPISGGSATWTGSPPGCQRPPVASHTQLHRAS